jgi:di/tricarboxylate transporter
MFEISPVGVPVAIVGAIFISIFARHLLPDRRPPAQNLEIESREYSVRLQVSEDCPLIGKSVEGAGLRSLKGLYLAEIERGTERIVPVRPTDLLRQGDRLVLFGVTDTVVELRKTRGLLPVDDADDTEQPELMKERNLYEVVVSANSPLVGSTLRSSEFRRRYDAAVIAIQRNGERLRQKLGEVELEAGDTLMVAASPGFHDVWRHATDFYLVSEVKESERPRYALAGICLTITALMIAAMSSGIADPALASATAAILLILTRCIQVGNARNSIDVSVMVVIAAAFGISAAVTNSGLAATISSAVVGLGITSPVVMLAVVYLMTVFFTELLTNNAAAALAMPVALAVAQQAATLTGTPVNPRPFAIAVAIAASMSFITPIGYQTNLMVYGPGGYRFSDFARIGVPLSIVTFIVSMLLIPQVWSLS